MGFDPAFQPIFNCHRRRKRKLSRTEWRTSHRTLGKKRTLHGGRGKIYGLKSKKRRRRIIR